MELRSTRSSRSRSRTPFIQTAIIDNEVITTKQNHIIEEKTVTHSYSTRHKSQKLNCSLPEEVFGTPPVQKFTKSSQRGRLKTSDYSSEEDHEVSSSKGNGQSGSQVNSEFVSSNGKIKTPLQLYKEAGEYWNKYPKTDYTYSIHSKDRVEIAPGMVIMPNMSRRSLHSGERSINQQSYSYIEETDRIKKYEDYKYNYRDSKLEPKALFRDEVDSNSITITRRIYRSVVSTFIRLFITIYTLIEIISQKSLSPILWLGREYYKFVCRVLQFDVWILQSKSGKKRIGPLMALLLLPLLLFAGWWLWSGFIQLLQGIFLSSNESVKVPSSSLEEDFSRIITATTHQPNEQIKVKDIVSHLLNSPEFENIILNHINSKTSAFDQQQQSYKTLMSEIENLRKESIKNNVRFTAELNRCCKRQFIHIESYVRKLFSDLTTAQNANVQLEHISGLLNNVFVAKQDLEIKLANISQSLHSDYEKLIEVTAEKIMNDVTDKIFLKVQDILKTTNNVNVNAAFSDSDVHKIVREVLSVYDADKTGLVDYALEPSGGQILSTRCTESFNKQTAVLSIFGIPLWSPSNTPRLVITPGVIPGECWAFQNFPGFLVIELSTMVNVTAFSLEHIPKSLAPGGIRDSAPKKFSVWGLQQINDRNPWHFGDYEYNLDEPSLQFFHVQNVDGPAFKIIELRIESNHGNINYTCLYRFRVHGMLINEPT